MHLLQRVNLRETRALFFYHARQVICEYHEIRTLQGLLHDYIIALFNFMITCITHDQ